MNGVGKRRSKRKRKVKKSDGKNRDDEERRVGEGVIQISLLVVR